MDMRHLGFLAIGLATGFGLNEFAPHHPPQGSDQKMLTIGDFPDLGMGLRQTPGVLEVKSTRFGNQQAIFAWFKNKAAVQAWYAGKMHRDAMKKFFPNMSGKPQTLPNFPDTKSPLLVVATVTPSDRPMIEGSPLAVSEIAIEIYTPVSGGIVFGGGFGPATLEVPGMVRIPVKHSPQPPPR